MQHEYFPIRIRKMVERKPSEKVEPTFSGGTFLPDLVNQMKEHLRKIELAQIASVQEYKEVVRARSIGGRPRGKIWDQIVAARKGSQ
jgi:hypothetical protein